MKKVKYSGILESNKRKKLEIKKAEIRKQKRKERQYVKKDIKKYLN